MKTYNRIFGVVMAVQVPTSPDDRAGWTAVADFGGYDPAYMQCDTYDGWQRSLPGVEFHGLRTPLRGEWIVRSEDGRECIYSDALFRRCFQEEFTGIDPDTIGT